MVTAPPVTTARFVHCKPCWQRGKSVVLYKRDGRYIEIYIKRRRYTFINISGEAALSAECDSCGTSRLVTLDANE